MGRILGAGLLAMQLATGGIDGEWERYYIVLFLFNDRFMCVFFYMEHVWLPGHSRCPPEPAGRPQHDPGTLWACGGLCLVIRRRSRGPGRPTSPPARPQDEGERSGADHPGSRSGSGNFRKI